MNRRIIFLTVMLASMIAFFGCSGGDNPAGFPVMPDLNNGQTQSGNETPQSQTHLWGFYDVVIDPDSQTAIATPNRDVMFTANVTSFINGKPANLGFKINSTPVTSAYTDVDIDVSITHPFPALPQYRGYDVRGVFMGDGFGIMKYKPGLQYALPGSDQMLMDDPDLTDLVNDRPGGGPDGYTRWFNANEFFMKGILGYTPGIAASKGYKGDATLNPYKYFADELGKNDKVWNFLATTNGHGVFSNGKTNSRNYYIRFPNVKQLRFAYAIIANWAGETSEFHPSNAPEPMAVSVTMTDGIYYQNPSLKGGYLFFDVSVFDWDSTISTTGAMTDYVLKVESTVLKNVYTFNTSQMTPIGGNDTYSTYHCEIAADNVTSNGGNEFWLIAECDKEDYSNEFGVPNDCSDAPLAAFFRHDINILGTAPNFPPTITGIEDNLIGGGVYKTHVNLYNTSVNYTALFTDLNPGDTHTITWAISPHGQQPGPANKVTLPVNWSTYLPGDYDIHVYVHDGYVLVHSGPYPIRVNALPVIVSGITGENAPLVIDTKTYTVVATDADPSQTLLYSWTLLDKNTMTPVTGYNGVPGNGAGSLSINWKTLGATHEYPYLLKCSVRDGVDTVHATDLNILPTVNLYYVNFSNGAGNVTVQYSAYPEADRQWNYATASKIWRESGGAPGYYNQYTRSRLSTPTFAVPAGITGVRLDLRQWSEILDSGDWAYIQYTLNNWTTPVTQASWTAGSVVGSSSYNTIQTYTMPAALINKPAVQIGLYFYTDLDILYQGEGWNVREIRVYIVP